MQLKKWYIPINLLSHGIVFIYLKTLETLGWHDIQTDNLNNNNNDDNVNVAAAANNTQQQMNKLSSPPS